MSVDLSSSRLVAKVGTKVFFDGGAGPRGMALAVVIAGRVHLDRDLGPGTSMTAEWLALLRGAALAIERGLVDPVLIGDAAAVIAQAKGEVRCPPAHRDHRAAFLALAPRLGRYRLRYLKRTQNLAGIALASPATVRSHSNDPSC